MSCLEEENGGPSDEDEPRNNKRDDVALIARDLQQLPVWTRNEALCTRLVEDILPVWKRDLDGTEEKGSNAWQRIRKRFAKEMNECEPILTYVQTVVEQHPVAEPPVTVVDLCSGFGVCSMILAEILPPNRVSRIELLDRQWPHDPNNPTAGNISIEHLTGRRWPVPMHYRKRNLKAGREVRMIHERVLEPAEGPVIMIGIHLCRSLSVRAIQLFQGSTKIDTFCLKPCCLPGRKMVRHDPPIVWEFGNGYCFGPKDVYIADDDSDVLAAEQQQGNGHRRDENFSNGRFSRWVELLRRSCEGSDVRVEVKEHEITKHYFHNKILYCRRTEETLVLDRLS
jgi:hypothetical protein